MNGPEGGTGTVAKVDNPSKVDSPSESGRSRVKVDGLLTISEQSRGESGEKSGESPLQSPRF